MINQCGIEVTRVVRVFLKKWQNDSKIPVKRFNFWKSSMLQDGYFPWVFFKNFTKIVSYPFL